MALIDDLWRTAPPESASTAEVGGAQMVLANMLCNSVVIRHGCALTLIWRGFER